MKYDDIPYSFIDGILPSCKSFKLYNSNNKKNLLLYLKAEEMKPLIFEFNMI
jgi:hypothetical protein